jgi:hypothetical protein
LDILSRFVIPGIAFILTLAFGLWLSRLGRPYCYTRFTGSHSQRYSAEYKFQAAPAATQNDKTVSQLASE